MRGKPTDVERAPHTIRIIPAHAGQTDCPEVFRLVNSDHPRACGANHHWSVWHDNQSGSSPRMRGKLPDELRGEHHGRIIPAHAGQTPRSSGTWRYRQDHPRACGANQLGTLAVSKDVGSSPRMRGKPVARQSSARVSSSLPMTFIIDRNGSSPRMRGKQHPGQGRRALRRIIPAHAGQTRSAS